LGNAIFAATGVRLRSLPVDRTLLAQNGNVLKTVVGDNCAESVIDGRARA
jgi:isoquinoline 1-oxidoreductase beta subunit